jgi:hypothetical protein
MASNGCGLEGGCGVHTVWEQKYAVSAEAKVLLLSGGGRRTVPMHPWLWGALRMAEDLWWGVIV